MIRESLASQPPWLIWLVNWRNTGGLVDFAVYFNCQLNIEISIMPTLREQLAEAKAEYHALITGNKARVAVDSNGERIEFTAANSGRLKAYIDDLERQLGVKPSLAPMGVYF